MLAARQGLSEKSMKRQYDAVDIMKFICAVMVVALHTKALREMGSVWSFEVVNVLGRIAVPFFFLCSGFFFTQKLIRDSAQSEQVVQVYLKRLGLLYGSWCLVYFVYDFLVLVKDTGGLDTAIVQYLRNLIFAGAHFHLWYLPALMLAAAFLYLGFRLRRMALFMGIACLLYLAGLCGDAYIGVIQGHGGFKAIYDGYISIFITTRNGLFFGAFYVMLGAMVAEGRIQLDKRRALWLTLTSFFLLHLEAYLLAWTWAPKETNMYLSLAPFTVGLFILMTRLKPKVSRDTAALLRSCSMGVYFIHGVFLVFYEKLFHFAGIGLTGTVSFLLTALTSIAVVVPMSRWDHPIARSLFR